MTLIQIFKTLINQYKVLIKIRNMIFLGIASKMMKLIHS